MALKITTQISTDSGLTSEGYVRIINYSLNKENYLAEFKLQIFKSQEDSIEYSNRSIPTETQMICRNKEIGEILYLPLIKEIDEEITEKQIITGPQGSISEKIVTKTIKKTVPDFSKLVGVDIFTVGYNALKTKLVELYGQQNVVNC